jgi:Ca2+:H+ antiporter
MAQENEAVLDPIAATAVLAVATTLVTFCADYLVNSIDDLVETSGISRSFIGLILIPIVGNATEHVSAVIAALHNNMDLAMSIASGSSIQIGLLVTPFLVIVGWITGSGMSLHFETCK